MVLVTSSGRAALLALLLAAGAGFAAGLGPRVRARILAAVRRLGRAQSE